MKLYICVKNIKNIQFNNYIFKICNYVNFLSENCKLKLQSNLLKLCSIFKGENLKDVITADS